MRWGTRPDQKSIDGTLATLPEILASGGLKPPATIIVGDVVGLRDRINWYERLPLFGRRIVITRDRAQAGELTSRLCAAGAETIELPVIEIRPPADGAPLAAAIERLHEYDWLIFTSANGVRHFLEALDRSGRDLRSLRGRLCAIGPATAHALEQLHLKVDVVPEEYVANRWSLHSGRTIFKASGCCFRARPSRATWFPLNSESGEPRSMSLRPTGPSSRTMQPAARVNFSAVSVDLTGSHSQAPPRSRTSLP